MTPGGGKYNDDRRFAREVGRRATRRAAWLRRGERPLAMNLAMIGALGWLVVTPTLAGVFLGRWLDRRFDTGILWSGALLTLGVAIGSALAWRRVGELAREDEP
jgi:ATP synthase protein I